MTYTRSTLAVWFSALIATASCGGNSAQSNPTEGTSPSSSTTPAGGEQHGSAQTLTNDHASAAPSSAPTPPPAEPVTVTMGTSTPIPDGLHPRVVIESPRENALEHTNSVQVRLHVTDWPAPQDGRHIHLILDNEPYRRVDDPTRPIVLENLTEGTHVLRAFPGWMTHESVKVPGAFAVTVFHVGRRNDTMHFDPHAPLLTYSRPKGDYNGSAAEHILLDFYVSNLPGGAMLSATGYRVHYAIDGTTQGDAAAWVPYYIDHLPDGAHTITMDFIGPNGQPVAGPFNHIERTIHVNRAAPNADEHHHDGMSGAPMGGSAAPAPMQH